MVTFLLLVLGFLAGLLGALTGIGGGVILTPILALHFGIPIREAIGTSLVAVITTSAASSSVHLQRHTTDIRLGMTLELATALGAAVMAYLVGYFNRNALEGLFAAFLLYSAITILSKRGKVKDEDNSSPGINGEVVIPPYEPKRYPLGLGASLVAGMLSGLLGIGGGPIKVPVMYIFMNVPDGSDGDFKFHDWRNGCRERDRLLPARRHSSGDHSTARRRCLRGIVDRCAPGTANSHQGGRLSTRRSDAVSRGKLDHSSGEGSDVSQLREPAFDRIVALVLRTGAFACFFVMLAGLVTGVFLPGPIPGDIERAGVLLMLATPVVRVIVACFLFFREKDMKYGWISLGVLVILMLGALFGIGEH